MMSMYSYVNQLHLILAQMRIRLHLHLDCTQNLKGRSRRT